MLLDLEKVPPEGQVIDRSVDPSMLSVDPREFRLVETVALTGHLARAEGQAYRLEGHLASHVEVSCVRCLEPFEFEIRERLDLVYLPQSQNVPMSEDDEYGLGDDDLAVAYYRDEEIDLAHMIWEQIVLALPMKPVCKPECRGLCPECGVNRNEQACSCSRDTTDPRWQALKSLLDEP